MVEIEFRTFWHFIFSNGDIVHHSMVLDGPLRIDLAPNLFCLSGLNWERFRLIQSVNVTTRACPQKFFSVLFSAKKKVLWECGKAFF
ncbi:MAG: hypothetical protein GTO45_03860 [Candidatus Aminicenantes bacterium]|nr:hypothetical protein [Candidatus Aminicenantes bacterium]NIM77863.1 hypothetical protein [Candidatus Aminicenantes bacterium]NIN17176.1 hypothetical protein [Candidatus Aminicenantes bacterium]NIN41069.1 hypothetical protein [Candidatus Aminicenantes bacterium]NIN83874.1 hypothetical protein [Candidatus Aminicenantes bacterium]